jgi:hypothetical protein
VWHFILPHLVGGAVAGFRLGGVDMHEAAG